MGPKIVILELSYVLKYLFGAACKLGFIGQYKCPLNLHNHSINSKISSNNKEFSWAL